MLSIIIAFPRIEDAKNIKNVLIRCGYEVSAVCNTGAQAIGFANELDEGIVMCGYRLPDMHYGELHNYLPKGFEMLLMASPAKLTDGVDSQIVCLDMPIKTNDLINTLEMMAYQFSRQKKKNKDKPKQRSEEDKQTILKAKTLLMERNNMSEEEAHRYIQKTSMDSGNSLIETAQMLLAMM